jgi:hypothetical protein
MTLPKPTRKRALDQRVKRIVTFLCASTLLLILLVLFGLPRFYSSSVLRSGKKIPTPAFKLAELEHEKQFHDSIRSCLPASEKKCKTYIPDVASGSKRVQRVALIALPGGVRSSLAQTLDQIKQLHKQRATADDPEIDVIVRASVPPYGYGKTHGLTKIVRIHPRPLVLEATAALQSALDSTEGMLMTSITLADLKAAMRLVLRFHCRLSHVSAHTAIMSLPMDDLLSYSGMGATKQLQAFVTPLIGETAALNHQFEEAIASAVGFASEVLSRLQKEYGVDVWKVMDAVLVDELNKTKSFSAWPCLSFWAVGDEPNVFDLSPIVQRIARSVSPDCLNDALANCWVGRDKCEAHGDGPCRDDGKQYGKD